MKLMKKEKFHDMRLTIVCAQVNNWKYFFFMKIFFVTVLNKVFIRDSQCFILFYHVYRYIIYNTYFKHLTVLST